MLARFPRLQLLIWPVLCYFLLFALLRLGFYSWFLHGQLPPSADVQWQAWFIGLRFDLRLALLLALPLLVLSWLPAWFGLRGGFGRGLALLWISVATLYVIFTYIVDFAHYAYLDERVNVSVLRFLEDGTDSFQMVWESYPVPGLLLVLFAGSAILVRVAYVSIRGYRASTPGRHGLPSWGAGAVALALVVFGLMGKVGTTIPLRWSDAYFANDLKVASLGLNPVLFFLDTLSHQTRPYDEDKVVAHYDEVATFLGVQQASDDHLGFVRRVEGQPRFQRPPNVVFIHVESMGANRLGLFGNPTGATPNLDRLGREGLFFPNFMVPSSGTARTVFGLITGIPDVSWGGTTASRNPMIVDQYTLVNAFEGYRRLYFIGGSAGWANIKGVLESNIDDLELWEEGDWQAPNVDVWGISDYMLFRESHQRLAALPADEPFVAFIQTAGNHRPFTIPDEGSGFEVISPDPEWIMENGFLGLDQFNAVRLLDFNIGYYLDELVAGSHYADNTIFVFYGDHNDRSMPTTHMGYSERLYLDKHHVPLIIYAPGLVSPAVHDAPTSLVDVIPTVLGLIGLPYENRTLGRDVLSLSEAQQSFALTFGGDRSNRPLIGLLGTDFHLSMYHDGEEPRLLPLQDAHWKNDQASTYPDIARQRIELLHGIYQTARYMLHHNRNEKHQR